MTQASLLSIDVPAPPRAGEYTVLYVDDPWPEHGGGKIKRGADRHYGLMKIPEIRALPFGEWAASNAHLYMWATNNYMEHAFTVMRDRGFRFVTMVTWVKDRAGLGQYYRGRTEHCLFGVRGRLPYRIVAGKRAQGHTVIYEPAHDDDELPEPADLPSAFEAPHPRVAGKVKHSKKPEQMRRYIELVSGGHGPMLECFAREAASGWHVWGNEAP